MLVVGLLSGPAQPGKCCTALQEVDIGLAADVGVLQRLPRVIGSQSLVNELVFTCRKMEAAEAMEEGLVSRVFRDKAQMLSSTLAIAKEIACKSPVAVQSSKVNLVYSRSHGVEESLKYMVGGPNVNKRKPILKIYFQL